MIEYYRRKNDPDMAVYEVNTETDTWRLTYCLLGTQEPVHGPNSDLFRGHPGFTRVVKHGDKFIDAA